MKKQITKEIKDASINNMIENLPVLRAMRHLSQDDLACLIGLSRQTIVMIENKKRTMSWSVFLALMFVFSQTKETNRLLETLDIYADELIGIYKSV